MDGALFRQEVVQARAGRIVGRIVVVPAWPLWAGVVAVSASAVALMLLLALGSYTRQTRVMGELRPSLGAARLEAPMAGVLVRLQVREGQRVLAGQPIAVIHAVREGRDGEAGAITRESLVHREQAQKQALAASREQLRQRKNGLQQQIDELSSEASLARAQHDAQRRRLVIASGTLARMRQLRERRYVSELQLAQHEADVLDQEATVLAARRQSLALDRSIEQARRSLAEWPTQWAALQAESDRDAALLRAEAVDIEARSHALLRAPVAGIVDRIEVHPGQPVRAGQWVLGLLPAVSRLEAHLHVPSAAMGLVAPGDSVQLRYHAYPYQDHGHFGGRVVRVDGSAPEGEAGPGSFRVVVALDQQVVVSQGAVRRLKPGLSLEANVLGERRPLWRWAIHPIRRLVGPVTFGNPLSRDSGELSRMDERDAGIEDVPPVL